jgi:dihydroorotase
MDIEHKKMEFDLAKNGTIGLESAFGALQNVLPLDLIIEKLTFGKTIFALESESINVNAKANLTLFTPQGEWTFTKESVLSKSKNSAFFGMAMKGKVYGVFNQGKLILQ